MAGCPDLACAHRPQRAAVAVALVKSGKGQVKINGCPIELIEPETLRFKVRGPL